MCLIVKVILQLMLAYIWSECKIQTKSLCFLIYEFVVFSSNKSLCLRKVFRLF